MYTVHLLRNNRPEVGYIVFATDASNKVLQPTTITLTDYRTAVIEASIVFQALKKVYSSSVACYIENNSEATLNVQYVVNEFIKTQYAEDWLTLAYEVYESRLGTDSPISALLRTVAQYALVPAQVAVLKRLVGIVELIEPNKVGD